MGTAAEPGAPSYERVECGGTDAAKGEVCDIAADIVVQLAFVGDDTIRVRGDAIASRSEPSPPPTARSPPGDGHKPHGKH